MIHVHCALREGAKLRSWRARLGMERVGSLGVGPPLEDDSQAPSARAHDSARFVPVAHASVWAFVARAIIFALLLVSKIVRTHSSVATDIRPDTTCTCHMHMHMHIRHRSSHTSLETSTDVPRERATRSSSSSRVMPRAPALPHRVAGFRG